MYVSSLGPIGWLVRWRSLTSDSSVLPLLPIVAREFRGPVSWAALIERQSNTRRVDGPPTRYSNGFSFSFSHSSGPSPTRLRWPKHSFVST